jgi:hypothetical protein
LAEKRWRSRKQADFADSARLDRRTATAQEPGITKSLKGCLLELERILQELHPPFAPLVGRLNERSELL